MGFGSRTYTSVSSVHKELSLNYFIPESLTVASPPTFDSVWNTSKQTKDLRFRTEVGICV